MQKYIVVTGGTKGIGRAIVDKFAAEGFHIITCSRHLPDLDKLKLDIEQAYTFSKVFYLAADVSQEGEVRRFLDYIKSLKVKVDVLVNNAGFFVPGEIHQEDDTVLRQMINTNLYSAYDLTKGLVTDMIKRRDGHIFTICSTASITAYTNGGSYCIAKHALYGMTRVLREELKPHNIRVTAVLPGATYTASWEGVDLPQDRFMKSEDVAFAIWNAHCVSKQTVIEELLLRPQLGDI
ncbi:SDR family NAD(P)-dependent oxidoreductase [Rufibacter glacialis]|uniref:SDR family NAD(P)-dependent oxidoreductase n=1 Tax=Rufibacter glacialis TaxID=1259555 RepID=A0A5M8QA25_9BACT|nr:SDR family oxidoreductase [Rufibacter glacialis]KAA6431710.1 SDR family oxidoreductase [Rufibacter glacialis]GGK82248.1 oxidoreductase [Rufibacter glacialis]